MPFRQMIPKDVGAKITVEVAPDGVGMIGVVPHTSVFHTEPGTGDPEIKRAYPEFPRPAEEQILKRESLDSGHFLLGQPGVKIPRKFVHQEKEGLAGCRRHL